MSLLNALRTSTTRFDEPWRHWEIEGPLSDAMVAEVAATVVPEGSRAYDGTRAADNGGGGLDAVLRCYVTPDNIEHFPALAGLIDELRSPETVALIEDMIERRVRGHNLRVEGIVDRNGFWLQPHKDIREKLMSMQLYVNVVGESEALGTDIYDAELQVVKTIPYRNNWGYMFAAGSDTWHGLERKAVRKERRSILINYVTFETGWAVPG